MKRFFLVLSLFVCLSCQENKTETNDATAGVSTTYTVSFENAAHHEATIQATFTNLKNKETEFNEETNWYKALTFIQMNDNTAAKKLLNQIVKKEGFYKTKAEEKLKSL